MSVERGARRWPAALLALFLSAPASAQIEVLSTTVDGGGGTSTGGGFEVSGTVGQPDAAALSGGGFELERCWE